MSALIRGRRLLVAMPLVFFALGVLYVLVREGRYEAESRVRPSSNQADAGRFSGLAAQLGVALPFGNSDPLRFYSEILTSHQLLSDVLRTRFVHRASGDSLGGSLIDLLKIKGRDPEDRMWRAVEKLRKRSSIQPNEATGAIRIRVTMPWSDVAEQVNRKMLDLMDRFSVELRQRRATAEQQFMTERMVGAQRELRLAEDSLAEFSRSNRSFQGNPTLMAESARRQRAVDFRQQIVTSLAQSHEQARIDAVRNTPVLAVIDPPEGTAHQANRIRDALVWLIIGLAVGIIWILLQNATAHYAEQHPVEWNALRAAMPARLRRVQQARRLPPASDA
jgi:capsule polysaccharide export protein KpsE/RkpR